MLHVGWSRLSQHVRILQLEGLVPVCTHVMSDSVCSIKLKTEESLVMSQHKKVCRDYDV